MTEADVVARTAKPHTAASLTADLLALGVRPGETLLVHSSLSALGWVVGGAQAVVEALLAAVDDAGTLVMPAYSTDNSEPAPWRDPAVPRAWWPTIRAHMPAFDTRKTPTRGMGRIAELFRTWPGAARSHHPALSFSAIGPRAAAILGNHGLEDGFGENSPLARVYDLKGRVLLLGVGHNRNSSLHLAEHRADWPGKTRIEQAAAVQSREGRQWVRFSDVKLNADDFEKIGAAFEETGGASVAHVGNAGCRLMPQPALVDFAVQWMSRNRP
jgi:aminoglycoside 3-N-acetyltransferase